MAFFVACKALDGSSWSIVMISRKSSSTSKTYGCQINAHIDGLHIFDYLIHFVHCSLKRYHCYVRMHSYGIFLDSFVDSSSLSGSRQLHDFLPHKLRTMMLCHFSCYMGNISLYVLHVLGKCCRSISSEQNKHLVDSDL